MKNPRLCLEDPEVALALCVSELTSTLNKLHGGNERCKNFFKYHATMTLEEIGVKPGSQEFADETSRVIKKFLATKKDDPEEESADEALYQPG